MNDNGKGPPPGVDAPKAHDYQLACTLARRGEYEKAAGVYKRLIDASNTDAQVRALCHNDLATLNALQRNHEAARRELDAALRIDPDCQSAKANRRALEDRSKGTPSVGGLGTGVPTSSPRYFRILLLANFDGPWANPAHLANVLVDMGHLVTRRHEFAVASPRELLADLQSGDYDCMLFSKGRLGAKSVAEIVQPTGESVAKALRQSPIPAYMWYVDRVDGFDLDPGRMEFMRRIAPLCRVAFVTDGMLARHSFARFRVLRQGIFEHMVGDVNVPEAERRDVAFVGSLYGDRDRELAPVRQVFDLSKISNVFGPELTRALRSHRITLGPRYPGGPHYWSDRIYVVLGHGGFFLAPEFEGMREDGLVPGVHYARLGDDPVADIRYWLARPIERERISRAGRQLAHSRFTYRNRLDELCRVIAETI